MLGYFDVFPEKSTTELRTATFTEESADSKLPCGLYVFTEYFCTDLRCNCQRVLVKVLRARPECMPPEEVAAINFSWNPDSDETWKRVNSELPNPFLDPFHRQAPYASELLDFWRSMIKHDKAYASRLQRHYDEIRAEVGQIGPWSDARRPPSREAPKPSFRPLTKRERRARERRLARARKE